MTSADYKRAKAQFQRTRITIHFHLLRKPGEHPLETLKRAFQQVELDDVLFDHRTPHDDFIANVASNCIPVTNAF